MEFCTSLLASVPAESRDAMILGLLAIATFLVGVLFVVALVLAIARKSKGWLVLCIVSALLGGGTVIGAGVMLSRVIQARETIAKTGDGPKQRLFSEDKSYSIEVPKAWKNTPKLHAEAGIASTDTFERTCVMVLADPKGDFAGSLESFDELTVGGMKEALESPEVSDPERKMFGAFRGIQRRLSGKAESLNIVYHRVSVETADSYYQIIAWTAPSREKQERATFQRIFESFKATAGPVEEIPGASSDTGRRAVHVVAEVLGMEVESIKPESHFVNDLGADDLDTVEIVMSVEEEFGVEMPDEVAEKLTTVGDLVRWLEQKPRE